jgi:hypothetical protein
MMKEHLADAYTNKGKKRNASHRHNLIQHFIKLRLRKKYCSPFNTF